MRDGYKLFLGIIVGIILVASLSFNFYTLYTKGNDVKCRDNNNESNNQLKDESVNKAILNVLYDIVGLPNGEINNECLNYYISNSDYNKYAKEIITYYGNGDNGSHRYFIDATNVEAANCQGAADCNMITKSDAKKLIELFNLNGNESDYFETINDSTVSKNWYKYSAYHNMHGPCEDNLNIKHNISSELINETNIKISDNQIITYEDNGNKTITKSVEYYFKTNSVGNYHLEKVIVK